ncbi:MAG TPA: CHAT domain-containing protein, partial [Candidatus Polarisedimenticolia bacterium]|nr:CHAT domain-containing protein [Candidatus Polarisedimenticolia bacterium]
REIASGDPSAPALQARGLADLLRGHADGAVRFLEEAGRLAPHDARIGSDLAGAWLARADATDSVEDRVRALDTARHAMAFAPGLPEARFNFALALESLTAGRRRTAARPDVAAAMRAWTDFLGFDSDSGWATEARLRLAELRRMSQGGVAEPTADAIERAARDGRSGEVQQAIAALPRLGREVFERRLLPGWAEAELKHDTAASAAAGAPARLVAEALLAASQDDTASGTIARIEALPRGSAAATDLARALLDYRDGIRLHDDDRIAQALPRFESAEAGFSRAPVPLQQSAGLYRAICEYYEGRPEASEARVRALDAAPGLDRRPSLRARVRAMLGLLLAVRGRQTDALDAYESSLRLYAAAGEADGMARDHMLIAETLGLIGDDADAWRHRAEAIAFADRVQEARRRPIHVEASLAALRQGFPWAAVVLLEPAFTGAKGLPPADRVELQLTQARLLSVIGDERGADKDRADAATALRQVEDAGMRDRLTAELALAGRPPAAPPGPRAAASAGKGGPDTSGTAGLEASLRYFEAHESETRVPEIELALGKSLEASGRYEEAARHYGNGLATAERVRARLRAEAQQIRALDRTRDLDDAMIRLQAGPLSAPGRALAYAERARRRELDLDPDAFTPAAAPGTTVLSFVLLDDRVLRWVGTGESPQYRPGPPGLDAIERLVADLHAAAAERDDGRFRDVAGSLYDLLIFPVEDLLPREGGLRIVPDRCLADVPFAALYDRRSRRYLVERFDVAVAPSLAFAPRSAAVAGRSSSGMLVVADPAFDAERFQGLPRLPAADAEGRAIAAAHPGAVLLAGSEATPARFLAEARGSGVIHVAAHAFVNEVDPLSSALLLAPAAQTSGLLTVAELRAAGLASTRLVVLGACSAVRGGHGRSAGSLSLGRPFLMAGVPEIVGPLWDVRDREAGSMLAAFHQGLDRGLTPLQSLCAAQRAALAGSDAAARSPSSWGALELNSTLLD